MDNLKRCLDIIHIGEVLLKQVKTCRTSRSSCSV